ncbi:MAG: SagB/ThcOx family dehydrogenase [Thermodesulfobacteriota bacterium]
MTSRIQPATTYHRSTEYDRNAMQGHYLDWSDQPDVYKRYPGIRPLKLPAAELTGEQNLWTLSNRRTMAASMENVNLAVVGSFLRQACCLTARVGRPGQDFYYRSVPSAGALYPAEIYLAASSVAGLESGLYHYDITGGNLIPLRQIGPANLLDRAAAPGDTERLAASFLLTGIIYRSAWKYRSRAYRYVLLDAGHLLENMILAARSLALDFSFGYDFNDRELESFMGIDGRREVCLACFHVYGGKSPPAAAPVTPVNGENDIPTAAPVCLREVDYPEIEQLHRAGIPPVPADAGKPETRHELGIEPRRYRAITRNGERTAAIPYPEIVFTRRSRRNFVNQELPETAFDSLLELPADVLRRSEIGDNNPEPPIRVGFFSGAVEHVPPGLYLLDPDQRRIGLVREGQRIREMAAVCLDQEWLSNSALLFLFMADLDFLHHSRGPRGYRHAMMTAGRLGQIIHLSATALGLGCCGIGAFYDGEARTLLGLRQNSALLYVTAVGPVRRL